MEMKHLRESEEGIKELYVEASNQNIELKAQIEQLQKERDKWKYESMCEHDHAVGFMRLMETAIREMQEIIRGKTDPCNYCEYGDTDSTKVPCHGCCCEDGMSNFELHDANIV